VNNTTPSQPIGVDGQYLGALSASTTLFTGLLNPRNLRESELSGRVCTKCAEHKPADDFNLRVGALKDGTRALYSLCRACNAATLKADYEKNKSARAAHNKAYRLAHIEHYREYEARPERKGRPKFSETRKETCKVCDVVGGAKLFFAKTSWRDTCSSCRKSAHLENVRLSARHRSLEIAKQRRVDGELPRTCTTCGYTGKQKEFYSNRILRDTCKTCRWDARSVKIGKGHAERLQNAPLPATKVCTRCKEELPAANFRISRTKLKAQTLVPMCKSCVVAARAEVNHARSHEEKQRMYRAQVAKRQVTEAPMRAKKAQERADKRAAIAARTEKACTFCKAVKKLEFFSRFSKSLDGHGSMCKACQAEDASRRRALDPEGYLAKMRARNTKNPERAKHLQDSRKAMLKHPEWAEPADIRAVFAEAEFMTKSTGVQHSVDHIWPLKNTKVSGLHVAANLRVVSKRSNSKKLNKLPGFLRDQLWDPDASDVFYEQQEETREYQNA